MDSFKIAVFVDGRQNNFLVDRIELPDVVYVVRSVDGDETFKPRKFYADKENCTLRFPIDDSLDRQIASAIEHWCLTNQVSLIETLMK
ncbi:hypothetical protein [Pollutibacter soli]|uniref:hypothetical protein n=1 Tax=Pollutibacter soli TaxID=3034157 RepID=UPI00301390E8